MAATLSVFRILSSALLLVALPAAAQDFDDWEDPPDWQLSGYVEFAHASRFRDDPLFSQRATRSEAKLQLELGREWERLSFSGKVDLYAEGVLSDGARHDLREFALTWRLARHWQVKAGRQVLSWGLGDLMFINDRFPKDFSYPLGGGEDFYFKAPSDSLRFTGAVGVVGVDFAYTPRFTPDRYIDGERLGFFDPRSGQRVGGQVLIDAVEPRRGEWALRLHRSVDGIEYAAYAYRGFDKQPLATREGVPAFTARDSLGASLRRAWAGGILSAEAGREWARHRPAPDATRVPHRTAFLLAFERELLPKFTAGVQMFAERYANELGGSHPLSGSHRHVMSLRLTQVAQRDKLRASVIVFHSPDDGDRWLRATVSYRVDDAWLAGLAVNEFAGPAPSFFGQLERDSQAGVWLRRQF